MFKAASPAIYAIRLYQKWLSPVTGNQCRFHPTCSAYGIEALETHGLLRGAALTIWRILRCQPLSRGPWNDPVPPAGSLRFAPRQWLRYNRRNQRCGGGCCHNHDQT